MSKPISALTQFQNQTGPIPLSQLDADLALLWNASNDMSTYSNYMIDSSGAPNSITVTPSAGLAFAYTAGIWIEVKIANTNTSTTVNINVAALGNVAVKNPDGSNPAVGQLVAGGIYAFQHDGTNFQIIGGIGTIPIGKFADGTASTPSITFASDTTLGLYKSGTDILGITTAGVQRVTVGATGQVVINSPSSALVALAITGSGSNPVIQASAAANTRVIQADSTNAAGPAIALSASGTDIGFIGSAAALVSGGALSDFSLSVQGAHNLVLGTNSTSRLNISSTGATTVNGPSAGSIALTVTGSGSDKVIQANAGANSRVIHADSTAAAGPVIVVTTSGTDLGYFGSAAVTVSGGALADLSVVTQGNHNLVLGTNATSRMQISGTGVVQAVDDGGTLQTVGWRDCPNNSQTASYQLVLADRGKSVDFNGASLTCTIPANGTTAFPVGTTIVITNENASALSIAITTDTLTLAGTTTTGTRSLAQNGMCTILKVTTTSWLISGAGLT